MKTPWWKVVVDVVAGVLSRPAPPPRQIDEALEQRPRTEDLEVWREGGGGQAPPEAEHIDPDGI